MPHDNTLKKEFTFLLYRGDLSYRENKHIFWGYTEIKARAKRRTQRCLDSHDTFLSMVLTRNSDSLLIEKLV